jgi:26S proteasome regulatory subunit N2
MSIKGMKDNVIFIDTTTDTKQLFLSTFQDFKFPKNFEVVCNSKPSVFAYPKKLEEKKEEKKKRVETVTLSTTAKEKARLARKRAKEGGMAMDVEKEESKEEKKEGEEKDEKMDTDKEGAAEEPKKVKKKREPEPTSFRVGNPARITTAQSAVCEFDLSQRYRPIRPEEKPFGVVILTDSTPGEAEDLGAVKAPSLEPEGECAPPEPFEWAPPGHPDAAPEVEEKAEESDDKMSTDEAKKESSE